MNDFVPSAVLIGALLLAVYLVRSIAKQQLLTPKAPPPGTSPGTLRLGQFAVQPGAQWLVLTPGAS
jgi:hypothetical protein